MRPLGWRLVVEPGSGFGITLAARCLYYVRYHGCLRRRWPSQRNPQRCWNVAWRARSLPTRLGSGTSTFPKSGRVEATPRYWVARKGKGGRGMWGQQATRPRWQGRIAWPSVVSPRSGWQILEILGLRPLQDDILCWSPMTLIALPPILVSSGWLRISRRMTCLKGVVSFLRQTTHAYSTQESTNLFSTRSAVRMAAWRLSLRDQFFSWSRRRALLSSSWIEGL